MCCLHVCCRVCVCDGLDGGCMYMCDGHGGMYIMLLRLQVCGVVLPYRCYCGGVCVCVCVVLYCVCCVYVHCSVVCFGVLFVVRFSVYLRL